MRGLAENKITLTPAVFKHLDACLDCRACETVCPAGVSYGELIEQARMEMPPEISGGKLKTRIKRFILTKVLGDPLFLGWLGKALQLYQKSGLKKLISKTQILKLFPETVQKAEALLPEIQTAPKSSFHSPSESANSFDFNLSAYKNPIVTETQEKLLPKSSSSETPKSKLRIALFRGCIAPILFPQVEHAVMQVLSLMGCEVLIPKNQICCGALLVHSGFQKEALDFVKKNLEVFRSEKPDFIVTTAAGCGSWLKECSKFSPEAEEFSSKVKDFTELIHPLNFSLTWKPLPLKVVYLDACHLLHAQKIKDEPRELLNLIPDLQLLNPPHPDWCCGSAGIYNLTHPELAEKILEKKMETFISLNPDIIAVGNPGCALQIRMGLKKAGLNIPILHPAELLQMSLMGTGLDPLLKSKRCQ